MLKIFNTRTLNSSKHIGMKSLRLYCHLIIIATDLAKISEKMVISKPLFFFWPFQAKTSNFHFRTLTLFLNIFWRFLQDLLVRHKQPLSHWKIKNPLKIANLIVKNQEKRRTFLKICKKLWKSGFMDETFRVPLHLKKIKKMLRIVHFQLFNS